MNCMCVVCCNSKRSGLFVCAVDCKAHFVGDTVPADGQVNLEVCFRCELHTLCTSPPTLPSPRTFLFYTCTHGVDFFVLHLYTWSWFFCFMLVDMELIFLFYTCTHGVVGPEQHMFLCAKSCLERLFCTYYITDNKLKQTVNRDLQQRKIATPGRKHGRSTVLEKEMYMYWFNTWMWLSEQLSTSTHVVPVKSRYLVMSKCNIGLSSVLRLRLVCLPLLWILGNGQSFFLFCF